VVLEFLYDNESSLTEACMQGDPLCMYATPWVPNAWASNQWAPLCKGEYVKT